MVGGVAGAEPRRPPRLLTVGVVWSPWSLVRLFLAGVLIIRGPVCRHVPAVVRSNPFERVYGEGA
eukprot:48150-Eustigmatos_ZCMA.PRE.1